MYLNKLGKRSLSFLAMLLALSIVAPAWPVAAQTEPRVAIEPPDVTVQSGQEFTVTATVADVSDLGGYELHLAFDPSVVEVVEVEDGGFLESSGRSLLELGTQIDAQAGTVVVGAVSLGQEPGAEGSGELVRFTLQAVGAGESDLDLLDERMALLDTAGGTIPFSAADGGVRVASGAVEETPSPQPATTNTPAALPTATPGATATPSEGATSAPTATPSEQPTMSGATATKTVTDTGTSAPTATIAGSEDQASSVPSATADQSQTTSETRTPEATEVPQTDEAEEEASSTSSGTPAVGATEAPAISAMPTAEAPAEGPGSARWHRWLIAAAAVLAALGAALIGGGVLLYSRRRQVDGDAFVEDEREMDDDSLQTDDPDRAGGGAS